MGLTVYMFPGQGSQYPGMRKGLGEMTKAQRELFDLADEILGFPLSRLIDEGPESELTRTSNAQPALLAADIAFAAGLDAKGMRADIVMGHSLGEYAALVHAGVFSFEDGIRIVRRRGELMERAARETPGKMAAVIGMSLSDLEETVARCRDRGVIEITNVNSPSQTVISGQCEAVDAAVRLINEGGRGKAMELAVSAPFHSSLMEPVAEEFASFLAGFAFHPPRFRFIDNVTGSWETDPEAIRRKLVAQISRPVQWEQSVRTAAAEGADTFYEAGPGSVLAGLVKRIVRGCTIRTGEAALKEA